MVDLFGRTMDGSNNAEEWADEGQALQSESVFVGGGDGAQEFGKWFLLCAYLML